LATVYTARTELFEIKISLRLFSTLFVHTEPHLVTSDYELLLVITLSETRFITRISSEPVPYFYVPHRLTPHNHLRVHLNGNVMAHAKDSRKTRLAIRDLTNFEHEQPVDESEVLIVPYDGV
jgi:hypothetical protein